MDKYYLTTDHHASSYGYPVLVRRADGAAFGPDEIIETGMTVCNEPYAITAREWVLWCVLGYTHPDHALGVSFVRRPEEEEPPVEAVKAPPEPSARVVIARGVTVISHDETEDGPRVRRMLRDKHGLDVVKICEIDGLRTGAYTAPTVALWRYVRPSGNPAWLIEAQIYYPPDVVLYRSYGVDAEPTDDQIREIVAADAQKGSRL